MQGCDEQTVPLTAEQISEYFRIVCEIVPECMFTSELPVIGLTIEQINFICEQVGDIVLVGCETDAPTPHPSDDMATPYPTISQAPSQAPFPFSSVAPTRTSSSASPTGRFAPSASPEGTEPTFN